VIEREHEKAVSACSLLNDGLHEHLSALVNDQLKGARSTTVSREMSSVSVGMCPVQYNCSDVECHLCDRLEADIKCLEAER
jgi:hypothetical protein